MISDKQIFDPEFWSSKTSAETAQLLLERFNGDISRVKHVLVHFVADATVEKNFDRLMFWVVVDLRVMGKPLSEEGRAMLRGLLRNTRRTGY